jgi:gamma-glutamyl phosphate reductase
MDITSFVLERATEAKKGARELGRSSSEKKNSALLKAADAIRAKAKVLTEENHRGNGRGTR